LVERRGQRGRGELGTAGSPERRAAVLVLSCSTRKTMAVFFFFFTRPYGGVGSVAGCCDFWPWKREEKEKGVRPKIKNLEKRFGCRKNIWNLNKKI
jgi:hypothetical protein